MTDTVAIDPVAATVAVFIGFGFLLGIERGAIECAAMSRVPHPVAAGSGSRAGGARDERLPGRGSGGCGSDGHSPGGRLRCSA